VLVDISETMNDKVEALRGQPPLRGGETWRTGRENPARDQHKWQKNMSPALLSDRRVVMQA